MNTRCKHGKLPDNPCDECDEEHKKYVSAWALAQISDKTCQERYDSLLDNGWIRLESALTFRSASGNEIAVVLQDGTYFRGFKQDH